MYALSISGSQWQRAHVIDQINLCSHFGSHIQKVILKMEYIIECSIGVRDDWFT